MVYGYIRVSSDKQTVENQRFEITNFCAREGLSIDGWIEETISGTKSYSKRNLIAELRAIGMSQNKIAKICNVDRNPLSRFIRFKMAESRGCTGTLKCQIYLNAKVLWKTNSSRILRSPTCPATL